MGVLCVSLALWEVAAEVEAFSVSPEWEGDGGQGALLVMARRGWESAIFNCTSRRLSYTIMESHGSKKRGKGTNS